jgi:putative transposase
MQSSKQNISKKAIELEIYKTFEPFKKTKNVSIAKYLKNFDSSIFQQKEYRKIKFPYETLIKLHLYQQLKGIKFHTKLTKHLKRNPKDKFRLGFSQTPDRRTIGYFINHILDKETIELLNYTANKIEEISEKFGILLDIKIFDSEKPQKQTKIWNQYHTKNKKTKEICHLIKKRFSPFIDLNLNYNTVYSKNQFINLIIHIGQTRDFAENGNKTFKQLRACGCPNADTLLYHLKNYQDPKQLHKMFITLFEIVWQMTRQANIFDTHKRYDVAIDFTEWYFYGDRSAPMIVGKEPDRGSSKCYKFATINIVETCKRFTLLALPVGPFDNKNRILENLIQYTQRRIKIKRVYVDRGFFDSESIKIFHRHHVKYLMPCTHISTVKSLLEFTPAPAVITDFVMADITFNLVILQETNDDDKPLKYVFATNEYFNENDGNLTKRLFLLYGKRWGIESSYRVKKQSFLPKTTSKSYLIRLFYFMFSVLLYNLWILADILIHLALFGIIKDDHLLTSKYFGTVLYTIDPGG